MAGAAATRARTAASDRALRTLPLAGVVALFRRRYASHFLLPSLAVCAAVRVWPESGQELAAFVVAGALLVSAAERALHGTVPFSERRLRRVVYRLLSLAAVGLLVGFAFLALAVPLVIVQRWIDGADAAFAVAGAVLASSLVFARFWPVYVLAYLYRGTPADLWGGPLQIKLPDVALAWRLTAVAGAWRHATLPVAAAAVLAAGVATLAAAAHGVVGVALDAALFLALLPFVHLLVVERATALALANEGVLATAWDIAESGLLWFVPGWRTRPVAADAPADPIDRVRMPDELPHPGPAKATWPALGELLGVPPGRQLERIGRALSGAYRIMNGVADPSSTQATALDDGERAALAARARDALERLRPLEARTTSLLPKHGERRAGSHMTADHALLLACHLLEEARPDLAPHDSRRLVVEAYRRLFDARGLRLSAEDHLLWLGEDLAAPALDETYRPLVGLGQLRYWEHPLYRDLWERSPASLPDGALLALLPLSRVNVWARQFENEEVLPVRRLLERYGIRLRPALVEYLRRPHLYPSPEPGDSMWPPYVDDLFEIASRWPRQLAEPIFRSALASGWNVRRFVAGVDWGEELMRAFHDGPHRPL